MAKMKRMAAPSKSGKQAGSVKKGRGEFLGAARVPAFREQVPLGLCNALTVDRGMSQTGFPVGYDARVQSGTPGHTYTGCSRMSAGKVFFYSKGVGRRAADRVAEHGRSYNL